MGIYLPLESDLECYSNPVGECMKIGIYDFNVDEVIPEPCRTRNKLVFRIRWKLWQGKLYAHSLTIGLRNKFILTISMRK